MTSPDTKTHWHRRWIEPSSGLMAILTTVVVSIGGLVEIVPMFSHSTGPDATVEVAPYTPLQLAGRDLYVREGCMTCHSQMVRPMRSETLRYGGEWSRAYEYEWDRPFLLGSRRIGPDLHRVGGKYPDAWHYEHLQDPRKISPGSIMPIYPWLIAQSIDPTDVQASMRALQRVGTPYTDEDIANAPAALESEGQAIVGRLAEANVETTWDREVVAVIAYLQRLGTDRPTAVQVGGTP